METITKYQQQLLAQSPFLRVDNEYHNAIKEAFLKTQRHLFIDKFNDPPAVDWNIVTEENLQAHLPVLYANKPLLLYDEPDNNYQSTISQPAIVLKMLDWLELKKGHTVFEVGAGSGWDAALMGELVGEEGHIYSSEIIPKMAIHAKETIERLGISNVTILQSDGGLGYEEKAPFDRIIFTAGSYDLPSRMYHQLKDDGILLFVLKLPGGGDLLIQLKKVEGHFEAIKSAVVAFVKMAGKNRIPGLEPIRLEQLPEWPLLKDQESFRSPFWWGGSASIPLYWRMAGFRSFLGITSPAVRCFQEEDHISGTRGISYFGILDSEKKSLTVTRDSLLITYGMEDSRIAFMNLLHAWVDLGMPAATDFQLTIHPINKKLEPSGRQWIVDRTDSRFLFSLPGEPVKMSGS